MIKHHLYSSHKAIRVNVNEVINKLKKMEVRTQGNYHKQEEYLQQRSLSL